MLSCLATATPPSSSRAWQTAPHPHLPLIASACSDKTVRIYSLTSFTLLSTITGGHKRSVRCCAWKPSLPPNSSDPRKGESVLATGSFDSNAAIWIGRPRNSGGDELNQGEEDEDDDEDDYRLAVVLEGHDSEVKSIAWSPHGTFLATCSRDKTVWIWEVIESGENRGGLGATDDDDDYETVAVMQEHEGDVKCVSWHPFEEQSLASGSYDELVRVWREDIDGEWRCVGVGEGHEGTVWYVDWEPQPKAIGNGSGLNGESETPSSMAVSGPRIVSCSADTTIRLWKRKPKERPEQPDGPRMPSIIRNTSDDEEWYEEAKLPSRHERAVYAVAWSKQSKRIVSGGSDGRIVVYEERPGNLDGEDTHMTNSEHFLDDVQQGEANQEKSNEADKTKWVIVAETEAAHGVFEVNHVCWASRFDRGKRQRDEEIIISTGDDGEVKVWTIELN